MKFKKIIGLAISCAIAAGSVMTIPVTDSVISAEESRKTDLKWYDEIITLVQDDVAANGQHAQWYYMTDSSPFRTDGLNVTYNQDVVTSDCKINFHKGDSPSKYYNGKSFEYDIPIDIIYGGKDIISSVIAQIGRKNDANLDHQIDVRDAAIIARDVRTHIIFKRTDMSEFAKFLVTGNRKNNVYALKSEDASAIAKNLAEQAILRSTGKKLERTDGTSGCSLSLSSAKGRPGETIALQVIVTADNSFEALDAVVEWQGESLNANGLYAAKGTSCETAIGDGKMAIVTYGDDKVKNGAVSTISVTIPEDAKPGEELDVYFSDVKTFSVLGNEGSKDISDSVNVKGAKITVTEPDSTKPAVTTQAVTTTTTTATTVTSVSTSDSLAYTNKLGEGGLYDATAKRTDKTVVMKYYSEIGSAKGEFILPEGMKIIDIKGGKFTDDGKVLMDSEMGEITIEFPENIEPGLYEVTSNFGNAKPTGNLWLFFNEKSYLRIEDEEVTSLVVTTSAPTTTTTVTTTTVGTTAKTYKLGDANKDGKVDIRDAAHIAQILAKKKPGELDKTVADYNKDGKVNIRDAAAIAKYLSNKK